MKRLSVPQIVLLHDYLISQSGGVIGIGDENMLDSAANSPFQTFLGEYLYKSLNEMAAHLCYSLIKNHPFIDGNKRTGMLALISFLEMNGNPIKINNSDIVNLGKSIATDHVECVVLMCASS